MNGNHELEHLIPAWISTFCFLHRTFSIPCQYGLESGNKILHSDRKVLYFLLITVTCSPNSVCSFVNSKSPEIHNIFMLFSLVHERLSNFTQCDYPLNHVAVLTPQIIVTGWRWYLSTSRSHRSILHRCKYNKHLRKSAEMSVAHDDD